MKYEMIFGDEKLFAGVRDGIVALRFVNGSGGKLLHCKEGQIDGLVEADLINHPIVAMRRIIRTPIWTVEDQKAGKLPEVGSKLIYTETWDEFEFVGVIAGSMRWACKDFQDGFLYFFEQSEMSPIESPEEKARRERDAWARKASEFIDDELDCVNLVGEHVMRRFYNAMLSGELAAPKGGE